VPQPTDESDANMLPDPELNPLLNPLLAAHMGRWAEVYFTNPPEKRGQAISELLRELANGSASQPTSFQVTDDEHMENKTGMPDSFPTGTEPGLACGACAYVNSAGHEFCGMCGAPLQVSPEIYASQVAEAGPNAEGSWSNHEPFPGGYSVEYTSTVPGGHDSSPEPTWPLIGKALPNFEVESEPVPDRQRLYMRAALAILLAVLGFLVWRETEASSSTAAPESTLSRAPAQSVSASSAQQPSATRKDQAVDTPRSVAPLAANPSPVAPDQSGTEELAMAEKYLNGDQGTARDSTEAAQWLWKAVRKRNVAATMALSDLYLRGEGVAKSCDQARLLLDAAARNGATAAAERLRSLQASGCE
jgi:hypothetical protein